MKKYLGVCTNILFSLLCLRNKGCGFYHAHFGWKADGKIRVRRQNSVEKIKERKNSRREKKKRKLSTARWRMCNAMALGIVAVTAVASGAGTIAAAAAALLADGSPEFAIIAECGVRVRGLMLYEGYVATRKLVGTERSQTQDTTKVLRQTAP